MSSKWKWAIGIGIAAAIIYFSSTTVITMGEWAKIVSAIFPGISEEEFLDWWMVWWWVFVKGFHVLEYFVLSMVAGFGLRRFGTKNWIFWGAVLALGYACSDEWHQTFVPGRGGRITDVLIDGIGVCLGAIVMKWRGNVRGGSSLPHSHPD